MSPIFKKTTVLLLTLALSSGLASCSKKKAGAEDRFLNITVGTDPEYLDPGMIAGAPEAHVGAALFEGLVTQNPKGGSVLPGVAERWEISEDGRQYTFHLRKNALWSDGTPITAADFIYAWERVLNPKTAAQYAFILYHIKNAEAYNAGKITDPAQLGFKALDTHTIQVTLNNPTPFILDLMVFPTYSPVPQKVVEQFGDRWTRPENFVGNGPFMPKEHIANEKLSAVKNPLYWDAASVKLAGINFFSIEDYNTGLRMYDSGQLDIEPMLPKIRIPELLQRPDCVNQKLWGTYYYDLNVESPVLKDKRVRQALAMALDTKELTEKYLRKAFVQATNLVPPWIKDYPSPQGYAFDPTGAQKLLVEAGYGPDKKFPELTILYNTEEAHKLVAQVVQQMWKENLGIDVKLVNEEWKTFIKTRRNKNYQVARDGWNGDYFDPYTFLELFKSGSSYNLTGWVNSHYDDLLNAAAAESNPKKRLKLMAQAEAILLEEAAIIPIYYYIQPYLIKPYVHEYYPEVMDNHPYKQVWIEAGH